MKWIQGNSREQINLFPTCLDEIIPLDSEVRLIDVFVDSLPIEDYGFVVKATEEGRPKFHPSDLLKLFIYGYMNRIRSSRQLERACVINMELIWLMKQLSPDHNTINNFRKANSKAIKQVFVSTVIVAKHFELIGGSLLAGDSTKLRAQNSKKNNYNASKIEQHKNYIEEKLKAYQELLEQEQSEEFKEELSLRIQEQEGRMMKYDNLASELTEKHVKQISTSDPESQQIIIRNRITEVCYSVQTTVDESNKLLIDYEVTNTNDKKAMGYMLERAVEIVGHNGFTALYDKGYHAGSEFSKAEELGVEVLVAIPGIPSASQAPDPRYNRSEFKYEEATDRYICPEGKVLEPAPTEYTHRDARKPEYVFKFKKYRTEACKECKVRSLCTRSKVGFRYIERTEHSGAIERNAERISKNKEVYKKRQQIVEHPYGTIKRQWGFDYIITKKYKERASADVGLMMIAYNLRRLINILGKEKLAKYLVKMAKKVEIYWRQNPGRQRSPFFKILRKSEFHLKQGILDMMVLKWF